MLAGNVRKDSHRGQADFPLVRRRLALEREADLIADVGKILDVSEFMLLFLASVGPDALRDVVGEYPVADKGLAAGNGGAEAVEFELEV